MNLTADQLAELIAGMARSQNAIIEAVDRANAGWRNTHLLPVLSVAANMRSAEPRLLDLPSRVLLRYQGRAAVDFNAIKADLERLLGPGEETLAQALEAVPASADVPVSAPGPAPLPPPAAEPAIPVPPPAASSPTAPPAPVPARTPSSPVSEGDVFDFLKK